MSAPSSPSASHPQSQEQAVLSNPAASVPTEDLYQHEPLPSHEHFRILELFPSKATSRGGSGSGVRCRMHTERFADAEDKYATISYVWGDSDDRVPIVCDGKIFEVTRNLADALRHISDVTEPRFVWADAICINQDGDTEKGHQVKRMGKVYENAEEVLVWLGRDDEGIAEDSFELIRETNECLDHQLEIHGGIYGIPQFTRAGPISFDKVRWNKVHKLLNLPWFSRLWVVQEAALAKQCKLLCGRYQLGLEEVCELCSFLHYRPDLFTLVGNISSGQIYDKFNTQRTYQTVKSWMGTKPLINELREKPQSTNFLTILNSGRSLEASFEVDRVYAYLGNPLARRYGDEALLVEPDYSKSMQDVYFEMAYALLAHPRETRYLLTFVDHHGSECVEGTTLEGGGAFPSWMPHWDEGWRQYPTSFPGYWYRAGGLGREFNATVQDDKSLLLPAIIFDRVVWTSDMIDQGNFELNPDIWDEDTKISGKPSIDLLYTQVKQAFYRHYHGRDSRRLSVGKVSIRDAFSLAMVQHYASVSPEELDLVEHRRNFKAYIQAARQLARKRSNSTRAMRSAVRKWLASFRSWGEGGSSPFAYGGDLTYAHNRRFAITESGRFGLVPQFSETNDVCCICPGMKVPLILRPREDGRYGLVGDSYIHDVMSGKVMEQLERGEVKLENIVIV